MGLVAFFAAARSDYRAWSKVSNWLYGIMVALLVLVLVMSHAVLGAQRWISLGFFQFQPSEFAKLILIVVLAKFFAENYDKLEQPKYLLLSLAYLVVPMALVMKQPDLGTALVLMAIWLAMALTSRVRKLHLLVLAGAGLALLPVGMKMLKPFQRARLETFINPTSDPLHTGYNAVQSTITVGVRAGVWSGTSGRIAEPAEFFAFVGATHRLYFRGTEREDGLCGWGVAPAIVWGFAISGSADCV